MKLIFSEAKKIVNGILKISFFSFLIIWIAKLFVPKTNVDSGIYNFDALQKYHSYTAGTCLNNLSIRFESPKYDLAIVVPCFNVENYVSECVDSLLSQITNYKIQVVLIDDGSTDNTGKILDNKYGAKENVNILHQKNKGLSAARNEGIKLCSSKYITFVDSDDYITNPFLFETILYAIDHMSVNKDDMLIVGYNFSKKKSVKRIQHKEKNGRVIMKEINCLKLKGFACGKVYSSQLFSNVCFPEGYWFEDTINSLLLFHMANRTFLINDDGYFYRKHPKTITHSSTSNYKVLDTFYVTSLIIGDYYKLNLNSPFINRSLMRQIVYNYNRLKGYGDSINKSVFVETRKLLFNYSISKNIGLKYFYIYKALEKGDYSLYKLACSLIR